MATGFERELYRNITRVADALERIADALEKPDHGALGHAQAALVAQRCVGCREEEA